MTYVYQHPCITTWTVWAQALPEFGDSEIAKRETDNILLTAPRKKSCCTGTVHGNEKLKNLNMATVI